MNNIQFKNILDKILARKTRYQNVFPYNLGYFDGNFLSFDCWNLIKAIYWDNTIADNFIFGRYAYYNPSSGLGDWDGREILNACTEQSTDMSNIPMGAYLLYHDGSHAGVYIGKGEVVESTLAWGVDGVTTSFIAIDGTRSKNGEVYGYWSNWGKLPNMDYVEYPKYKKGELVTLVQGSKIYRIDSYFASWVYDTKLEVMEDSVGERAVISHNGVIVGACYVEDLIPYVEPKEEVNESPVESPNEGENQPNGENKKSIWIVILEAVLNAIKGFFNRD